MFRFSLAVLTTAALSAPLVADGPTVEPYVAYVRSDDCFVRSGPAAEYYRTDPVPFGTEIEVYLESPDGWLGIRPPESSFSWIPASQVEIDEENHTAKIIDPQAVAWIGTNLGKAKKFRWQVKLSEGEELVVLDQVVHESTSGKQQVWLQIVPPAGEFRWIHRKDVVLSRKGLDQLVAEREDAQRERIARANDDGSVSQAGFDSKEGSRRQRRSEQSDPTGSASTASADPAPAPLEASSEPADDESDWQTASSGAPRRNSQSSEAAEQLPAAQPIGSGVARASYLDGPPDDQQDAGKETPSEWQRSGPSLRSAPRLVDSTAGAGDPQLSVRDRARSVSPRTNPSPARAGEQAPKWSLGSNEIAQLTVEECQVEFSRAVAAEVSSDQLSDLAGHVRSLSESAEDKVSRARAVVLLERIDRYRSIARRRDEPAEVPQSHDAGSGYTTTATGQPAFDREGYLVQVYSARPNAPPFALTDRTGETIAYISPAPGLNLRRYLNEAVGIVGRTGYLTGLDTPHLIAERIVKLTP